MMLLVVSEDSQLGDKKIENIGNYIKKGKIWNAFDLKKISTIN